MAGNMNTDFCHQMALIHQSGLKVVASNMNKDVINKIYSFLCYRGEEAAASINDCHLCDPGYYCPDTNSTIVGTQCDRGFYCPAGSQNQTICQPGTFFFLIKNHFAPVSQAN